MNFLIMIEIALIWVLLLESGFIEDIESFITKKLTKPFSFEIPKPFSCSLCMTFWTLLVMLIVKNEFTISNLLLILVVSYLTNPITDLVYLIKDLFSKIIDKIRKIINK